MSVPYEAILLISFGGPEAEEEVLPFLENVLRGRNVPRERMLQVAEHYYQFGGVSPLNDQNRALLAVLEQELQEHGPKLPIYWGNRNWHPLLPDVMAEMASRGIRRVLAVVLAGYSSYSSCRQYLENIEAARECVGDPAPVVEKVRAFFNHPGFVEANAACLAAALDGLELDGPGNCARWRGGHQSLARAESVELAKPPGACPGGGAVHALLHDCMVGLQSHHALCIGER